MMPDPLIFDAYRYDDEVLWMARGCSGPPTVERIELNDPAFDAPLRVVPTWPSDQPWPTEGQSFWGTVPCPADAERVALRVTGANGDVRDVIISWPARPSAPDPDPVVLPFHPKDAA
jgi:hypothetical protein